jgi:hypothetical protein
MKAISKEQPFLNQKNDGHGVLPPYAHDLPLAQALNFFIAHNFQQYS